MIRTQISLSKSEYHLAKEAARQLGVSLAELLRRALRTMLPAAVTPHASARRWMHYQGMVASGNTASSQEIDDVIYGHKD